MSNTIVLKRSSVGGKVPLSANLTYGELALNYRDGVLYYLNTNNTVTTISSAVSGGIANAFPVINSNGVLVSSTLLSQSVANSNVTVSGNLLANAVYTNNYFFANGQSIFSSTTYGNAQVEAYLQISSTISGINANIVAANATIATLQANVGSFYTWANTNFGGSSYGNVNVAAYINTISINTVGNITANNITANNITANSNVIVGTGTGGSITGANLVSSNYFQGNVYNYANGVSILSSGLAYQAWANANVAGLQTQITGLGTGANANTLAYLAGYTGTVALGGNLSIAGNLSITGNITSVNYETVTYTENANVLNVAGTLTVGAGNLILGGVNVTSNLGSLYTNLGTLTANVGAFELYSNANVGTILTSLNTLTANVGAYEAWANATFSTTTYSNTNVVAYLTTANIATSGNITAANLTANLVSTNYFQGNVYNYANGVSILSAGLAYQTWANANLSALYSNIQASNANIGTYQLWSNANVGTIYTNLNTLTANVGAFELYANANAVSLAGLIANVQANLVSYELYANTAIASTYTNANVTAYLAANPISSITNGTGSSVGFNVSSGNVVVQVAGTGIVTLAQNQINVVGNAFVSGNVNTANINAINTYATNYLYANGVSILSDIYANVGAFETYANTALASLATGANANTLAYLAGYTGNTTIGGNLTVVGNLQIIGNITNVNYETVTYTENANVLNVAGQLTVGAGNLIVGGVDLYANVGTILTNLGTLTANVGAFELYANANIGTLYVGNIATQANIGTLYLGNISTQANIGTLYSGNIVTQANIGTLYLGNVATQANLGAFQTYANANIGTIYTHLGTLDANVGAYEIWANGALAGLNANITAANVAWQANAAYQQSQITVLQSEVYSNANVVAFLAVNSGNISTGNIIATGEIITGGGIFWPNGHPYAAGGGGTGITYTASNTTPSFPNIGDQWYYEAGDTLLEYMTDGTNTMWVDITGASTSYLSNTANISTNFIPVTNASLNLGSTTNAFGNLYVANISLSGATIEVDSASGAMALIPPATTYTPNPTGLVISPRGIIGTISTVGGIPAAGAIALAANVGSAFNIAITSSTAPTTPNPGDTWYDTANDVLYRYTYDGTNTYWVDVESPTIGAATYSSNLVIANLLPAVTNTVTLGNVNNQFANVFSANISTGNVYAVNNYYSGTTRIESKVPHPFMLMGA